MKVPRAHEPVVPRSSAAVFALMGAIAFGGPIDEGTCYNHEKALALLDAMRPGPRERTRFTAEVVAALAAHPEGGRKGVLPGMSFRVLLNQGDLEEHEKTALEALDLVRQVHRVPAALVSFQKREMYGAAD